MVLSKAFPLKILYFHYDVHEMNSGDLHYCMQYRIFRIAYDISSLVQVIRLGVEHVVCCCQVISASLVQAGLGRVPDLRVRVQVRVLVICVSTSTSPSTWLLHEYEYEYESWLMSTSMSTSTGLWSTFYINSSIAFFSFWKGNPQILMNPGQSYNFPLSM